MPAEFVSRLIDCSAGGTDSATVKVIVTVQGGVMLNGPTIERAGNCIRDLGRAIEQVYQKYDATANGRKPKS